MELTIDDYKEIINDLGIQIAQLTANNALTSIHIKKRDKTIAELQYELEGVKSQLEAPIQVMSDKTNASNTKYETYGANSIVTGTTIK